MAKPKGSPKVGGRVKGTPNKVTAPIREKFQQLLDEYGIDEMVKDLRALPPKDRMTIIAALAEYIVPKLARTEIQAAVETKEALKAIEDGAILITDNKSYVDSNSYNTGEKRLAQNLTAKGYNYTEKIIDGQVLGVWYKGELNPLRSEWIREELKSEKHKVKLFFIIKNLVNLLMLRL